MEQPLTYLKQRAGEDWLVGYDTNQFHHLTEHFFQELIQHSKRETPPKILLAEQNSVRFLAAFLAAVAANCPVFLCNPNWVEREWQQVFDLVQPDIIFGDLSAISSQRSVMPPLPPIARPKNNGQRTTDNGQKIMIPTGGSSGQIRFAMHTWETLMASVQGFHQYFGEKPINSFCVLPLYHVSGLMQFLRSFTTGGQLVILPFKALLEGEGRHIDPTNFFISLVPTQLAKLISSSSSVTPPLKSGAGGERMNDLNPTAFWLSRFQAVLLGGAPAWAELLEQARRRNIPVALTYGMTETASQVVTLKPEDFLRGNNSCGQVLPHARVTIRSSTGEILGANQTGIITIEADSLALGYYPEAGWGDDNNPPDSQILHYPPCQGENKNRRLASPCAFLSREEVQNPKAKIQSLKSDDLGFFDEQGYLRIIGRCSNKIITGGENVFPTEVEAAILATQLVADACVIGLPDRYWGQVVTAVYVPTSPNVSAASLQAAVEDKLCKFKRPKYWVPAESLPRNTQGKVNYDQLKQVATETLKAYFISTPKIVCQ